MKLKISSQLLTDGLKKVEKIINFKHNLPILQGVYVEVAEKEIVLIGSDSTETLRYSIPIELSDEANCLEAGRFVMPKPIIDLVKKLKTELDISLDGNNKLTIKYGKKSEVNFNVYDAEEYPKLPKLDFDKPFMKVKGAELSAFIKKTVYAASDSEVRPILQGVNFAFLSGKLRLVSTDAHRLGQVETDFNGNEEGNNSIVVSAKSLDKLVKSFDLSQEVDLFLSENQVIFKNAEQVMFCRLLEGTFPDTSKLIPQGNFECEVKLARQEVLNSLDRISVLSETADSGKGGIIKLHINGAAEFSTPKSQLGNGVEVVEYEELTGTDDFSITFSSKYLMDALKSIDDEHVLLKFQGTMRPFLVTPTNSTSDFDELHLILPVRTV